MHYCGHIPFPWDWGQQRQLGCSMALSSAYRPWGGMTYQAPAVLVSLVKPADADLAMYRTVGYIQVRK